MKSQSDTIAEIALNLSKHPVPTAAEILAALNLAYERGFAKGALVGQTHMANTFDKIFRAHP